MYVVAKSAQQRQREVSCKPNVFELTRACRHLAPKRLTLTSLALLCLALVCLSVSACEPSTQPPPLVPLPPQRPQLPTSPLASGAQQERTSVETSSHKALEVRAFVLASAIKRRLPVGVNTEFSSEEPSLWAWLDLKSHVGAQALTLRWRREGLVKASHALELKAQQRQRLWARLSIKPSDEGAWSVSLEDQAGRLLERRLFEVLSPSKLNALNEQRSAQPLPERPSLSLSSPAQLNEERPSDHLRDVSGRSERAPSLPTKRPTQAPRAQLTGSTTSSPTTSSDPLAQERAVEPKSEVRRLVVATSIKQRRPLGVSERFSAEHERLWGYLEVRHVGPPSLLWMEWWREGELRSRLKVKVGESLRWRTWSWQRLRPQRDAGRWTLKVLTPDKEPLAKVSFEVLE